MFEAKTEIITQKDFEGNPTGKFQVLRSSTDTSSLWDQTIETIQRSINREGRILDLIGHAKSLSTQFGLMFGFDTILQVTPWATHPSTSQLYSVLAVACFAIGDKIRDIHDRREIEFTTYDQAFQEKFSPPSVE